VVGVDGLDCTGTAVVCRYNGVGWLWRGATILGL
jgi:hypothetical protein